MSRERHEDRALRRGAGSVLLFAFALCATPAHAQQPLSVFLRGAADRAVELRAADASAREAGSRVDEARAALLPSLSLTAGYTRNETEIVAEFPDGAGGLQEAVISAQDQVEGRLQLDVPLVNVSAWSRFFGAESRAEAARARRVAVELDVNRRVVSAWYRLVAARALLASAEASVTIAEENAAMVSSRASAGLASELDRLGAEADVETARQRVAEAELDAALARRSLYVLSGVRPGEQAAPLDDALAEEPPLDRWLVGARVAPEVDAAERELDAASQERDAAWQTLLPAVDAFAAERYTNAAGFGPNFLWSAGVSLRWTLDFGAPATVGTAERAMERARADAELARQRAETRIYEAWHQARSALARARAARAAASLRERALDAARAEYRSGRSTQLALSRAQRDLLEAQGDRVRADADLAVARLTLRLESGLPPQPEVSP